MYQTVDPLKLLKYQGHVKQVMDKTAVLIHVPRGGVSFG
jgi:hypothetical protein